MEVKVENVSYKYNMWTKLEKTVLSNINITFKENMINVIMSNSGGGKTTLLELISGLLIPNEGSIIFNFKGKEKVLPTVGLVFKNPEEQFFQKTVKQELEFNLKKLPKEKRLSKIKQVLKQVGLDESYLKRNPFKLSKGEMKKIVLACVLIYNPKVILLDEPTVGLDDKSKEELFKLLRRLKEKNKTIIVTSQDSDFVNQVGDYIYILDKGKIILEGKKYDVFTNKLLTTTAIEIPKIIQFSILANKKGIKLEYHTDIKDLMKDVYRHVTK